MIQRDYLVVGAGIAGVHACQAIRQYDPKGTLTLVSDDFLPPHRHPVIDKNWLKGDNTSVQTADLIPVEWFAKNHVELRLGTLVTQFNIERRLAVLATGQTIEFKKALLATGWRPRRPQIAGFTLGNIIYPRTCHDWHAIRETVAGEKNSVVVGSGITGLEVASALKSEGYGVILLTRDRYLLENLLDPDTAAWVTEYAAGQGLKLMLQESLNGFEGKTVLKNIQLKSGTRFAAGMAVVALGSDPDLRLVTNTPLSSPNGCPVNEYLETDEKGIYAAGPIALYPDRIFGGVRRWNYVSCAEQTGLTAGANITGRKRQKFEYLPSFELQFFDLHLRFVGDFSRPILRANLSGERDKKSFTAVYQQGEKTYAAVLVNRPPEEADAVATQIRESHKVA